MNLVFDTYPPGEPIVVAKYLKNKKLQKYFNRETAAAVVGAGKLLNGLILDPNMPFYYATGFIEFEDYGLHCIAEDSADEKGHFSEELFIAKGLARVPPISQFKVLQNMPLCFVSIEHHLTGDNAVVYGSTASLLQHVLCSPIESPILMGAGKVYRNGLAEVGFALVSKAEIKVSPFLSVTREAVELFREWLKEEKNHVIS
ncbi:MAG: hypothetical protein BWK79_01440 [Beggiatoa sp. IS2]|nr:MAG: hypothetical protein BWK79_01440 [Beggiatoa sp. IS2]